MTKTKEMLDDMHKRKIDMADSIFCSMYFTAVIGYLVVDEIGKYAGWHD